MTEEERLQKIRATIDTVSREVIESIDGVGTALNNIAAGISPPSTGPGHDAYGNYVNSLLEAVMGIPHGLEDVADAIRGHGNDVQEAAGRLADAIQWEPEEFARDAEGKVITSASGNPIMKSVARRVFTVALTNNEGGNGEDAS